MNHSHGSKRMYRREKESLRQDRQRCSSAERRGP